MSSRILYSVSSLDLLRYQLQRAINFLMYRVLRRRDQGHDEPDTIISRLGSHLAATLPAIVAEDLVRQAGSTADAVSLMVDLQRSHERLVTAREEERRRLRRDLHDGLGPQLACLTLKLETARNRLAYDPLADALLSDLTQQTQAIVAEIRRLIYALRPLALDELGLVAALRELTLQSGGQVCMSLDAPDCLPELPAAVEVAVYRIVQEALTNVVRHAHACTCDIKLAIDEANGILALSVQDDGCGLPSSRGTGVGLISMRERAVELGGSWIIEQMPGGGTRILAQLPYLHSETAASVVPRPGCMLPERTDSFAKLKTSEQSQPSREQLPSTLGIGLMTREHLIRYALNR